MNNAKLDNKKFILYTCGILFLVIVISAVYLKKKFPDLNFKDWFHEMWGWLLLIILLAIILYWLLWRLLNKEKPSEVDTVIAEGIMKEQIALRYNIPLYGEKNKKGFRDLINQKDIQLLGAMKHKYPKTSVPYYAMSLLIVSDSYTGIDLWTPELDKGEEYIRNNYQAWFRRHTPLNLVDLMRKEFPSETPQSQLQVLSELISQKNEEGEDTTALQQMLSQTPQEEPESSQSGAYIPPPMASSATEQDVSKQMEAEYEQDIQKYKENNK